MRFFLEISSRRRSAALAGLFSGRPLLVVLTLLACGACTALLDRNATQCASDDDCLRFGGHPSCQSGVCVASGLGPADCFSGTPQQPADFLNQCSDSQCLSFDDCARVGDCADASDFDAGLLAPPAPEAAAPSVDGGASGEGGTPLPTCLDPSNGRPQAV